MTSAYAKTRGIRRSAADHLARFDVRWPGVRRRAGGMALALALECGLLLLLLTLGHSVAGDDDGRDTLTTVSFAPEAVPVDRSKPQPQPAEEAESLSSALPPAPAMPQRPPPLLAPTFPAPIETPEMSPAAPLAKSEPTPPASGKARAVIRDDMAGPMGPPNTGYPGDSQRIAGGGPDGEPLYAARWYREPYPEELRGYLSTASGPGWALINCKTASGFRVEQCVLVDEYPEGSGMGRAVLGAAWQFKVHPPQVGGRAMVGEWVRIRITYEERRN
ncbi:hypothetical protein GRI40_07640 [Altererythrobacter aerius]|uniref:Energy transducer TonB n=1 Tax=Tsuneonella aeria TaxID=1837929 RepID=A0A6I4TG32_9SPHN|nr:hypothetical protein [Tsuneonella aeria]MXO75085.1 hypothetical protein [Tsuneonella aeria]